MDPRRGFVPLEVPQFELLSNVTFVLKTGGPPTWLGARGSLGFFLTWPLPESWRKPDVVWCPWMCPSQSTGYLSNLCFNLELADPRRIVVPLDVPQPEHLSNLCFNLELADPRHGVVPLDVP